MVHAKALAGLNAYTLSAVATVNRAVRAKASDAGATISVSIDSSLATDAGPGPNPEDAEAIAVQVLGVDDSISQDVASQAERRRHTERRHAGSVAAERRIVCDGKRRTRRRGRLYRTVGKLDPPAQ